MWFYFLLYIPVSLLSILIWHFFLSRYKNIAWYFFYLFVIFASAWFIFYFLFFSGIYTDQNILLSVSRIAFATGIISVYNLVLFFKYFDPIEKPVPIKKLILAFFVYILFFLYTVFTDHIIAGLTFSQSDWVYREVYWNHYAIIPILYTIFFLLFIYYGFWYSEKFSLLSRLRLRNIVLAICISISILVLLQLILPYFWIWILEKEIILIYLFFVIYATYNIRRYYFSPLHQEYGIVKIVIVFASFIVAIVLLNIFKYFFIHAPFYIESFWWARDQYSLIDSFIVIILFFNVYIFLSKMLLTNNSEQKLKIEIDIIKQRLSDTTTLDLFHRVLLSEIKRIFKTTSTKIYLYENTDIQYPELKKYFLNNPQQIIFINDALFIEEHKTYYNKKNILEELQWDIMFVFPILNSQWNIFGLYFIGKKPLWDFYTSHEINLLFGLVRFLALHLKYLDTYEKIQNYSVHLDQIIDDKTIEYNDLINKQKEFISMISHEVRSPIGATIFHVDNLLDDIDDGKIWPEGTRDAIKNIWDQLIHMGDLLKKLFSIQCFDTKNVVLIKEKTQIGCLLEKEFSLYSRMYENIHFIKKISGDIWSVNIDKVHFHQVLVNLLENAIKFTNPKNPMILIESYKDQEFFYLNIEDNWEGYWDIDPSIIFEKYSTWNHAKLWLGMWLYLCKRIVNMHEWVITAEYGSILGWASFVIRLPLS